MTTFSQPLKVPATTSLLEAWAEDELASWEDHGAPGWEAGRFYDQLDPDAPVVHARQVLLRYKTRLEVRTQEEYDLVAKSAEYHGDTRYWDDRVNHRRAINRLWTKLATAHANATDEAEQVEEERWVAEHGEPTVDDILKRWSQ